MSLQEVPQMPTHYAIEERDVAWFIITIMMGNRAIGEFMIPRHHKCPESPAEPVRRARFVHVWGVLPLAA